jgi:hypothetical protein
MNINKKNIEVIYSVIALFIFLPLVTGAAGLVPCGGPNENACGACDLLVLVQNVLEFALKMASSVGGCKYEEKNGFQNVQVFL